MRIYFLGKNTKKTRSFSLTSLIALSIILIIGLFYSVERYIDFRLNQSDLDEAPLVENSLELDSSGSNKAQLDAYIRQISELYMRLNYIDQQTDRIQQIMKKQMVGKEKLPTLEKNDKSSSGGPFINDNLEDKDVKLALDNLVAKVDAREIQYNQMEAIMLKQTVLKLTLPTLYPVDVPYRSSSYGWRHDPILGIRAFHSGLDFSAAQGEPIRATADGRVKTVGRGPDYGKFVVIDHGDRLETRYAHASKILVNEGDLVQREDVIALVGNTGRSTGPHLHYEIRYNNRSLDPRQYLKK
jgi:murein DD-endopeptidase MepM/ murein hydrolase activator NlpD